MYLKMAKWYFALLALALMGDTRQCNRKSLANRRAQLLEGK
jgi:hypothetical protein